MSCTDAELSTTIKEAQTFILRALDREKNPGEAPTLEHAAMVTSAFAMAMADLVGSRLAIATLVGSAKVLNDQYPFKAD